MNLCVYACVSVCKPIKVFKQLRIKVADPLGEVCWPIVSIPYYLHWARCPGWAFWDGQEGSACKSMGTRLGSLDPEHGDQQAPSHLLSSLTDRARIVSIAGYSPESSESSG